MKTLLNKLKQIAAELLEPVARYAERHFVLSLVEIKYPTIEDFAANAVGIKGKIELIWQPLYDFFVYPTAGIGQLPFFTIPQGQGFSAQPIAAAAPKTEADTNLTQPGMLPSPQSFWVDGLEITVESGSTATANLFGNAVPTVFAAANAAAVGAPINDFNIISRSGLVKFSIMQKTYYQESPISRFPPRTAVRFDNSLSTTSATAGALATFCGRSEGNEVRFEPGYGIESTSNFAVTISWPALVVTTAPGSGFNARIGCFLNGWLFRAAQ